MLDQALNSKGLVKAQQKREPPASQKARPKWLSVYPRGFFMFITKINSFRISTKFIKQRVKDTQTLFCIVIHTTIYQRSYVNKKNAFTILPNIMLQVPSARITDTNFRQNREICHAKSTRMSQNITVNPVHEALHLTQCHYAMYDIDVHFGVFRFVFVYDRTSRLGKQNSMGSLLGLNSTAHCTLDEALVVSTASPNAIPPVADLAEEVVVKRPRPDRRFVSAMVVSVVLLCISSLIRYQMELAVNQRIAATRFSPFPLSEIPNNIGPWKGVDGELDPFIARKTGSTDYIMRRYSNQQTGAVVELLMLYGPAAEMGYHKPDACYPNAGYKLVGGGDLRPVTFGNAEAPHSIGFKNLVFQRGEGGGADRQQVYYVWRYSDIYALDLGQPSKFGRLPGMFKIQVARGLAPTESADGRANQANPCEDLLSRLLPVFESKVASGSSNPKSSNNTAQAANTL